MEHNELKRIGLGKLEVPPQVSSRMRAIKKIDTKPELMVRRMAHALGFRFRLHRSDLPGTPDLTFAQRRKVIFVHGCFWHQHDCRLGNKRPRVRHDYWHPKLRRNVERDGEAQQALRQMGWEILVIWECETGDEAKLAKLLVGFLGGASPARRSASR
jgi:DNA mismatch endonuclease (patch repair protein)